MSESYNPWDHFGRITYDSVRETDRMEDELRAFNEGKGYDCTLCADTGERPAPAPYGSFGARWTCSCEAGRRLREGGYYE